MKNLIIIFFCSFVVSLYLFEFYLNFSKDKKLTQKIKIYKKITGNNYDTRNFYEVFQDLKLKDPKIVKGVLPVNFFGKSKEILPLSGISNVKTLGCNENGYYVIFESDKYGFNNPDEEWQKDKNSKFLLVGDSFTEGACVNRPNDVGSVLRKKTKSSVLNLGHGGSGPLIHYAVLREYLKKGVRNIIWMYYEGNDLNDLASELKSPILNKYLENEKFSQNLVQNQEKINMIARKILDQEILSYQNKIEKDKKIKSKILKFIRLSKLKSSIFKEKKIVIDEVEEEIFIKMEQILKLSNRLAKQNNSNFYFVYLPEYNRYNTNYINESYGRIKKIVKDLEIPFIDIHEKIFIKEINPNKFFPFEMHGHYNIIGYDKVAKEIINATK